jgi:hypothetical protein
MHEQPHVGAVADPAEVALAATLRLIFSSLVSWIASTWRPRAQAPVNIARWDTISATVTASFAKKRRNLIASARSSASLRRQTVCRSPTRCSNRLPFFFAVRR